MTAGIPTGVDPQVLLQIGIVCLAGAVAMWSAMATTALTGVEAAGILIGTGGAAVIYVSVVHLSVPLVIFAGPAIVLCAGIIAVAAVAALVRVSRAEI